MRALSACHRLSLVIRQKTFRVESIPQRSNPSLFTDERGKLRPKGALTCLEPSQTQVRDSGFLNLSQKEQDLKWMSVPLWRHPVTVINGGAFDTQETGCTDGGGKGVEEGGGSWVPACSSKSRHLVAPGITNHSFQVQTAWLHSQG